MCFIRKGQALVLCGYCKGKGGRWIFEDPYQTKKEWVDCEICDKGYLPAMREE